MRKLFALLLLVFCAHVGHAQKLDTINTVSGQRIRLVTLPNFQLVKKYPQPMVYARWWKETMACSGYKIPTKLTQDVSFNWVNAEAFAIKEYADYTNTFGPFVGFTASWTNTIYVVLDSIVDESLVKHEMLHHILYHNGIEGHPHKIFVDQCHLKDR